MLVSKIQVQTRSHKNAKIWKKKALRHCSPAEAERMFMPSPAKLSDPWLDEHTKVSPSFTEDFAMNVDQEEDEQDLIHDNGFDAVVNISAQILVKCPFDWPEQNMFFTWPEASKFCRNAKRSKTFREGPPTSVQELLF